MGFLIKHGLLPADPVARMDIYFDVMFLAFLGSTGWTFWVLWGAS